MEQEEQIELRRHGRAGGEITLTDGKNHVRPDGYREEADGTKHAYEVYLSLVYIDLIFF